MVEKKLGKGAVVKMKARSGMIGYGNLQCVSSYCEPLGEISLYGHNQHYKDYDVEEILIGARQDESFQKEIDKLREELRMSQQSYNQFNEENF